MITPDMPLEDILDRYPQAITFFVLEGVSPMCCAGIPPETLSAFLRRRKIANVAPFLKGLNDFLGNEEELKNEKKLGIHLSLPVNR